MAAYASLIFLSETTDVRNRGRYHFPSSAKENISSIHAYVIFLLSFFDDFPEKASRWEGKIRDAAHRTEVIIEQFMWQQIQSSFRGTNLSIAESEEQLKVVSEEIGLIVGEIMDERPADSPTTTARPHPPPLSSSRSSSSSRFSSSSDDAVVGLEKDIMAIKHRLCGESPNLQVIPIVGMGGIGKTTLAKTVYEDEFVVEWFDIRAWVTVSQDYGPSRFRSLLLDLFDSMNLLGERMSVCSMTDESDLTTKIFQKLKWRRYLIVMDDVWGKDVCDDLRNVFPDDNNGSRVMLTTRQSNVAAYPDPYSPLHEMQFMDVSQSWKLLKQKVFADADCPRHLENIGQKIARSCAGLPLTLVMIAGLLSTVDKSRASWKKIATNVKHDVGKEVEEILSLSYTSLPHHLRPCFLFIGGFPEDAEIRASRLIRLWVAEGFLKNRNGCGKSLEEEADENLEDLVKRNLVIASSRKVDGKIKRCSLHDLVRDLCIRKSLDEKFLQVLDGRDLRLPQGTINDRRISFTRNAIDDNIWGPTIRTILYFNWQQDPSWQALIGRFRLLRVLDADIRGQDCKVFPSRILELFHLRYLALTCRSNIPPLISNLMNLQTLIIRGYGEFFSLPVEVWRMRQLRHLVFDAPYILPHPPNGSNLPLENLQTLWQVKDLIWNEKMVQMIPNVKRLRLVYTSNQDYHLNHLNYLGRLEKLEVDGRRGQGFSWRLQNPIFPMTLEKLTLQGGKFPSEDVRIIGSLPKLQVLELLDHACDGSTMYTADGKFPELKVLLIHGSNVVQWTAQGSPMPKLKRLTFRDCDNLQQIPEGVGEIMTLELIEVDQCNCSLMKSARQIREDQESYGNDAFRLILIEKKKESMFLGER